ncbi:4-coumarate--CoA ligase-like 1 [Nymphaea colorata]|nr:4-coumarate--CoA ligase-like 1 [Nymphaea colorata]
MENQMEKEGEEHIFRSQFPAVPVPENLTVTEFVLQDWHLYADNVAIVEAQTGKQHTYSQLVHHINSFRRALKSAFSIKKGDVVLVALPNIVEYPAIALAIMSTGGVFSGVNPAAHPSEILKQATDSEARLVVANNAYYEKVAHLEIPKVIIGESAKDTAGAFSYEDILNRGGDEIHDASKTQGSLIGKMLDVDDGEMVTPDDLCALPYSSGTTGTSKGVMLTHRNIVANLCSTLFDVPAELIGKYTTLGLMPFFHIYGIMGICCATIRNKGKVVAMSRFDLRAFLNALIEYEVNFAPIVPPVILMLVKNPVVEGFDLKRLKLKAIMTAAAPLAPELLRSFEEKFPGVEVQEAYGLTEHSCITLTHCGPSHARGNAKRNSVGFILPNLEVKFVDSDTGRSLPKSTVGEICVRSKCVMKGYFKNKEATEQTIDSQGWLHTGDIGYIDDDGDIFIVDRVKEMIKYKGFQVAPAELEAILLSHPSVEDVAVIPLPDEEAGEVPAACVVMAPKSKENEEDIMKFVASNVASYKRVRVVHFVETIPKSASGKIMRKFLKESILKRLNKRPVPGT